MTFQCEDQVSWVHVTYTIGTAYQECQQIAEDQEEEVRLVTSQYLWDLEYLLFCSGEKWPKTNLSLCLVLPHYLGVG